jgi:hypothetical protein
MRAKFYNRDEAIAYAIKLGGAFVQIFPNVIYVSRDCPGSFLGVVVRVHANGRRERCL